MINVETSIQVVRPIRMSDLDSLYECAEAAKHGIYSLPRDIYLLKKKILDSEQSFTKEISIPKGENYIFILEDHASGKVLGTCAICSKVGTTVPFYAFKIKTYSQLSASLNIEKIHKVLKLTSTRRGPTEIGGLFLFPAYRKGGLGRLLSFSRFLFMASHPRRFHNVVVAEMRGLVRDDGYSPFWEHLGRHFFQMDFPSACLVRSLEDQFIADLAPEFPIYLDFIPLEAQEVLGRTHESTLPALYLLQQEGFRYYNDIDIFDGGPDLYAPFKSIRSIKESTVAKIHDISTEPIEAPSYIVGTHSLNYRSCIAPLVINENGITISASVAVALEVKKGDLLRFIPHHLPKQPIEPETVPKHELKRHAP